MIAGLLGAPLGARVLPEGVGVTGDGDRPASLQEGADEIARVPPPSALHASPIVSDDRDPTETPDAPSEARIAN